ncbi:hypothetical protein J2X31_000109 [Flavobacterium arsenatis]|uniref:Secretion system C-terminal sorting domain-containing protein n=1 Tax=Flavobacterium arsenatis TaxID=1484332 RepID=A0ABU1TJV3_9FLAO|nr:T9SS type A sorting domain-containing protein [Flavobacterium arsenatis]MDR6966116.1 hypothetical protein [Flavobacterium arsenatis]
MKKSILTALFLGLLSYANAQEILYSQDFEGNNDDIFADGWDVIDLYGQSPDGGIFNPSPSIQAIGFTGKTIGVLTFTTVVGSVLTHITGTDVAIKSADYDLPDGPSYATLRVGSVAVGAIGSAHYSIYIMASTEFNGIATPEALKNYLNTKTPVRSETVFASSSMISIDLTAYAGQNVSLIFRLHDYPTHSNTILLFDDITIKAGTLDTPVFNANQFVVYPNPTSNLVSIRASNTLSINSITISDLNGRILKTHAFNSLASVELDLSEMATGTYFLGISSEEGTTTKKIIKS